MTIPTEILAFARTIDGLTAEAAQHAKTLIAMSETESGPQALGYDALASEMEQISKVLKNYLPRVMKHVGDLPEPANVVPEQIADLARESEPFGETRERLWTLFREIQNKLADNGRYLPAPTSEEIMLYARLYPHMGWLAKSGAVEVV
jgi:hypothetical protein